MIGLALGFLRTKLGLGIVAGLIALGAVQIYLTKRDARVAKKAVQEVVDKSKQQGRRNRERSDKARRRARRPGAAQRLRKRSCRDC